MCNLKEIYNKSLVRTQTTLRFVCAAQLQRYVQQVILLIYFLASFSSIKSLSLCSLILRSVAKNSYSASIFSISLGPFRLVFLLLISQAFGVSNLGHYLSCAMSTQKSVGFAQKSAVGYFSN